MVDEDQKEEECRGGPAVEGRHWLGGDQFWEQYFQKHTVQDRRGEGEHLVTKQFQYLHEGGIEIYEYKQ